jgi:hypothetical protein
MASQIIVIVRFWSTCVVGLKWHNVGTAGLLFWNAPQKLQYHIVITIG